MNKVNKFVLLTKGMLCIRKTYFPYVDETTKIRFPKSFILSDGVSNYNCHFD